MFHKFLNQGTGCHSLAVAERLDRFRRSGQTVAQFCDAEGVSAPSFYVWKRTLAATPADAPPTVVGFPSMATRTFSSPSSAASRPGRADRPAGQQTVVRGGRRPHVLTPPWEIQGPTPSRTST